MFLVFLILYDVNYLFLVGYICSGDGFFDPLICICFSFWKDPRIYLGFVFSLRGSLSSILGVHFVTWLRGKEFHDRRLLCMVSGQHLGVQFTSMMQVNAVKGTVTTIFRAWFWGRIFCSPMTICRRCCFRSGTSYFDISRYLFYLIDK